MEAYQVTLEDVDFTIPMVKVEWNAQVYLNVLLDGGFGVNILGETKFLKLHLSAILVSRFFYETYPTFGRHR